MPEFPNLKVRSRQILAALDAATPADLAAVARIPDPTRTVEVFGTAAPGPSGVLRAPLSGQPCVWYRSVTSPMDERGLSRRSYRVPQAQPPAVVPSSVFPPAQATGRRSLRRQRRVDESREPFAVVSATGEQVVIDPSPAIIDTEVVTTNQLRYDDQGWATALVQEWVIPPGRVLHLFGGVARDPGTRQARLVATPAIPSPLVATHERQYLTTRARTTMRLPGPRVIVAIVVLPALLVGALVALYVTGVL